MIYKQNIFISEKVCFVWQDVGFSCLPEEETEHNFAEKLKLWSEFDVQMHDLTGVVFVSFWP